MKLREYLRGKLTEKEFEMVPSSYDIVGDIAIFNEIPKGLVKKEKLLGNSLLELHKNIKVVCKKIGKYSGKYRTPKLKIIAGEKRKETIHVENGIKLMLDAEKVYFSARLGTERQRISSLVKSNEKVLVMFSGIGPYTIQIAKKARNVVGIEINPVAHKYALVNLKLNKIDNAVAIKGDVKRVVPKLKERFDRIIMPHPTDAMSYLKYAFSVSKKGTMIHIYSFAKDSEFDKTKQELLAECKKLKKKCGIMGLVKTGEYSPGRYRICIDFAVQ